jgi:hypothetical protein
MTHVLAERHGHLLRQGAVLLDAHDEGTQPSLLLLLQHEVEELGGRAASRRLQFVRVFEDGRTAEAGAAPHLDLQALDDADLARVRPLLEAPWVAGDVEARAVALAAERIAPDHFREVADRRRSHVTRTREAVHARLTTEIIHQQNRYEKLELDEAAGKKVGPNLEKTRRIIRELQERIETRNRELSRAEYVASRTPTVLGAAFVVPAGLLASLRTGASTGASLSADAEARARIERRAMEAVTRAEEARGFAVRDVSALKCGWDLEATRRHADGTEERFFLEVKGRIDGADSVTVTKNEVISSLNRPGQWRLAVVKVPAEGEVEGPFYFAGLFEREPEFHTDAVTLNLARIWPLRKEAP